MDYIFIGKLFTAPEYFLMVALTVVFSVCLHEYFHAQAALWEGDPTAADAGHLTLNPLKQMGVISIIMFCLAGICWGMVPTNPRNFKSRWSDLRISLAGPFANFVLFLCAWVAFGLLASRDGLPPSLITLVFIFGVYNFVLLVLNLLPVPGLDGWGALCSLCPSIARTQSDLAKGFMLFLIIIVLLFINYLYVAGSIAMALSTRIFA